MLVASAGARRIPVAVATADPVSRAGIASQLRGSQLIELVDEARLDFEARSEAVAVVSQTGEEKPPSASGPSCRRASARY